LQENKVNYYVPINKLKENKVQIVDKKVITGKRNILAGSYRQGNSNSPGVLFSYYKEDYERLKVLPRTVTSPKHQPRNNIPLIPSKNLIKEEELKRESFKYI
jgi:hypothetical protein